MLNQVQGFRLSPQQKRLWSFHERGTAYNTVCTIDCTGELDIQALQAALQHLVNQHEILRTSYQRKPGISIPIQVIGETQEVILHSVDLTHQSTAEQEATIAQYFAQEQRKALSEAAPMVVSLFLIAPQKQILVISLSALNGDAGTITNIIGELSSKYAATIEHQIVEVDEEAIQYLQFSEWQNELFESDEAEPGIKFWQQQAKQLAFPHVPGEINLQANAKIPLTVQEYRQLLSPALINALQQMSQRLDIAEETLLFATWQLLLWKLSGQQQLSTGAVFNGRKYEELQAGLGLFTTTLPVITRFARNVSFTELAKQIENTFEESNTWQEYYLSEKTTNESGQINFPISFEHLVLPAPVTAEAVTFSLSLVYTCAEPFYLKLYAVSKGQQTELTLQYNAESFAPETIKRLSDQYQTLLLNVLNAPDAPLSHFEILNSEERNWLLVDLNRTAVDVPQDTCFQTLFEAQVTQTPEHLALECEGQTITYAELNRRANQLAHYLRKQQVGPETRVALYLTRSVEVVVAILGVLKAGGSYVPLEPGYPAKRLQFQLVDTHAPLVLTQRQLATTLPETPATQLVYLDELAGRLEQEPETNPENLTAATNLAYIIYTSGSTGTPKGVMIPHRGLVNYLLWAREEYHVAAGEGSPVHSPLGFDLTLTSLLLPLIAGQKAILLPENLGVSALGETLKQQHDLSLVKLTPAHLRLLNTWIEPQHAAKKTQTFILGGEALPGELITFWQQHAPETRIINEYGPTESVVGCCIYEVSATTALVGDLPIGRPIMNTQLYILDTDFHPVPVETTGELYIGGAGLARGYQGRPDLTADHFRPNPFSNEPGARLYRTGDIASYQADGNIKFHGRNDQQVKIRGFRIEPGEIEVILKQHPIVRECLVRSYQEASGEYSLVAYIVVADPQKDLPESELRQLSKEKLPEYMQPTTLIPLPGLPLTENGKIDTKALPDPTRYQRRPQVAYAAPRTELEKNLTHLWQETLHIEKIGIQDNFFDLGGNSFLLIELTSKIQKNIDAEVMLLDMFEHPTISSQAQHLQQRCQQEQEQPDTLQQTQERARKQRASMARAAQRRGRTE